MNQPIQNTTTENYLIDLLEEQSRKIKTFDSLIIDELKKQDLGIKESAEDQSTRAQRQRHLALRIVKLDGLIEEGLDAMPNPFNTLIN